MAEHALIFSKELAEKANRNLKTVTRRIPTARLRKIEPGDTLIVKETHWLWGRCVRSGKSVHGRITYKFLHEDAKRPRPTLWEEPPEFGGYRPASRQDLGYHKRPSIFLPWDDARTRGRIKSIREEYLHEITREPVDCIREGIRQRGDSRAAPFNAVHDFRCLWASIYGWKGPKCWTANPKVLRIEWDPMTLQECMRCSREYWALEDENAGCCSAECESAFMRSLGR
jgi:hypothetical protein